MEFIRSLIPLQKKHKRSAVAIGNFDGLHRGHQALLQQLLHSAAAAQLARVVIIFEPHPQEFFFHGAPLPRLSSLREKCCYFAQIGIDRVVCIPFKDPFAICAPEQFIQQWLVNGLRVHHLVIGEDFRFGHQRRGDFALLQQAARCYGFQVISPPTVLVDQQRVSSSAIRQALQQDDLLLAERMLGRPYCLFGKVARGKQLGRQLGFPTANILLKRIYPPVQGVYAVEVYGAQKELLLGVANIGTRPTVGGKRQQLEVHLFTPSSPLYGCFLRVVLKCKLRSEQYFASLSALKQQIALDIQAARHFFSDNQRNDDPGSVNIEVS